MAIFIDTETIGLHGLVVLIQYAEDDGPIHLFSPWTEPVSKSIELIEKFTNDPGGLVFFNAVFDWFHLYKWWTICKLLEEATDPSAIPEQHVDLIIDLEEAGRDYPQVIKPVKVLDLFLHARKGPYQSTMDRKDVRLRKIPAAIAWMIAEELERRVKFKEIYFARRKEKNQPKWQVQDRKNSFGEVDRNWKDIVVRFKPSSALKALAVDALEVPIDQVLRYGDVSPKMWPVEFGYAPFAKGAMKIEMKNRMKEGKRRRYKYMATWPDFLAHHISHWTSNAQARKYAEDDITYTRGLYKFFNSPEMNDDDSVLACMVPAVRWRGFRVDIEGIKNLRIKALNRKFKKIINHNGQEEIITIPTAPSNVKRYIMEVCDGPEKLAISEESTKKSILETLAKDWKLPCPDCNAPGSNSEGTEGDKCYCKTCKGKNFIIHPAAARAQEVLDTRKADKEVELYNKILAAGRLHASFKVIGSLSGRMSGTDGLNSMAIKSTDEVKSQFLFGWEDEVVSGGDFDAFEITIAEAEYKDPMLRKDLLTCESCEGELIFDQNKLDYVCTKCGGKKGKKIHALFGMFVYPGMTYEEIKATSGKADDRYTKSKQCVFLKIYGGEAFTMKDRLGVEIEIAEEANQRFDRHYKGVFTAQQRVINLFQSMRQPDGRGTKVEWHEPADSLDTMFGFHRYFTLENKITRALFELASKMPKAMKEVKLRVTRTDRVQTAGGAACSALYSSAFSIQSHNKRAAINHRIQGTGAQITKRTQRAIWDLQPSGISEWKVQPFQVHDSINVASKANMVKEIESIVAETVESFRPTIPLIKLPWETYLANWADKGQGICSYDLSTGKIIDGYKNRKSVTKEGYSFKGVYRVLTKQKSSYKGLGWRLLSKDEHEEYSKQNLWKKTNG